MGKVVDSFYLVPCDAKCRPVPIDNRADFPYGGWRYVAWAYREKESWKDFDGLTGKEALGKWEMENNE